MGLKIGGPDSGPFPRQTYLILSCDKCRTERVDTEGSYPDQHHRAIVAGWSETPEMILCPKCKKGPAEAGPRMADLFE